MAKGWGDLAQPTGGGGFRTVGSAGAKHDTQHRRRGENMQEQEARAPQKMTYLFDFMGAWNHGPGRVWPAKNGKVGSVQ